MQSRFIGNQYLADDLFNKDVLYTFEELRQKALEIDPEKIYQYNYLNPTFENEEYAKKIEGDFVRYFFGDKYLLDYKKFLNRSHTMELPDYEKGVDAYIKGQLYRKRVTDVFLPETYYLSDIHTRLHEFSHYLNYVKYTKMYYDILKTEVPSIFIQNIFIDYVINNCDFANDGRIRDYYQLDNITRYLYRTKYSFSEIYDKKHIDVSYEEFLFDVLYFYGYIYANKLYELYLTDEKKFMKRYMSIYSGACLEELFDYYGIDVKKPDTVEPTFKLIKTIKENM